MVVVSNAYQSYISSDSVQLATFPSLKALRQKGYRYWEPQRRHFQMLGGLAAKKLIVDIFEKAWGPEDVASGDFNLKVEKLLESVYDEDSSGNVHVIPIKNLSQLVEDVTIGPTSRTGFQDCLELYWKRGYPSDLKNYNLMQGQIC
ncbi:unnamed protein product [Orchesella dallaii]|uniref:Uncharacterized protein n=1 Tax=Orchesella dallaii TaxID=48710 RepID=A0ABP1S8G4_9HEXA